ncbi:MAG: universal stress protein [Candidatus Binatia bacterium]
MESYWLPGRVNAFSHLSSDCGEILAQTVWLRAQFPAWKVQTEVCGQSPAWAIIEKAHEWKPDIIVLGSHNRSALGRLFLGSVSQTVLTETCCSVRIARGRLGKDPSPVQILIGVDGSPGAALAVTEVASRAWPPDTKAHLVAALDRAISTALDWTEEGFKDERAWLENIFATWTEKLHASGISVSEIVKEGDPKEVLVEEAERLRADCIFLGARGLRRLERFLLGSVSTAVAARAQCSVEIVRPGKQRSHNIESRLLEDSRTEKTKSFGAGLPCIRNPGPGDLRD